MANASPNTNRETSHAPFNPVILEKLAEQLSLETIKRQSSFPGLENRNQKTNYDIFIFQKLMNVVAARVEMEEHVSTKSTDFVVFAKQDIRGKSATEVIVSRGLFVRFDSI